jgi:transposase
MLLLLLGSSRWPSLYLFNSELQASSACTFFFLLDLFISPFFGLCLLYKTMRHSLTNGPTVSIIVPELLLLLLRELGIIGTIARKLHNRNRFCIVFIGSPAGIVV